MKLALAVIALCALGLDVEAKTKPSGTWTAPDVKPAAYRKVVVYAKLTDEAVRRQMEDYAVLGLKARGTDAVAAHQVLTPEDLASREAVEAKVKEIGVDAAVVFTVSGQSKEQESTATLSVGIGVGASSGPYGVFLGGSVPIGDSKNSTFLILGIRSEFHALDSVGPRWIGNYTTDLERGVGTAVVEVADLTIKNLKKARVLK